MKVLFVSSGNNKGLNPLVQAQGDSLQVSGCEVDYFQIKGKGIKGYLQQIQPLKKHLENKEYDIVHAHYSLSGYVAAFARAKPLVTSLMGSDVKANSFSKYIIQLFIKVFWDSVIVKSTDMKNQLGYKKAHVISNGVNLKIFKEMDQKKCLTKLHWNKDKVHILFASNPERPEKNYQLFEHAINQVRKKIDNIEVHALVNIPHNHIPMYMNAADVVALTSLWEGSPNVIKEAMACNRPIVSTKVGNIKWMLGNLKGCYLVKFKKEDVAAKIKRAIYFSREKFQTSGRKRIKNLKLDSETIAESIKKIYRLVSKNRGPVNKDEGFEKPKTSF